MYRRHVRDNGDLYIGATGNAISPYVPRGEGGSKEVLLSPANIPVNTATSTNAHPVRVFTLLSTTNKGTDLGCALAQLRKSERDWHGGNNCQPAHVNTDCGLNILIAVLGAYNKMTPGVYLEEIVAAVRLGKKTLDWAQLHFCHFLIGNSFACRNTCTFFSEYCTAHTCL